MRTHGWRRVKGYVARHASSITLRTHVSATGNVTQGKVFGSRVPAGSSQGTENRSPLPNPWAPSTGGSSSPSGDNGGGGTNAAAPGTAPAGGQTAGNMFGTPGMQSVMRQLAEDPSLVQNMMNAPYVQNMLQALAANPEMANQVSGGLVSRRAHGFRSYV